jgi:hypothetical protein
MEATCYYETFVDLDCTALYSREELSITIAVRTSNPTFPIQPSCLSWYILKLSPYRPWRPIRLCDVKDPAALGPGVLIEMSTGSRKIMFLEIRALPVRRSDNLTTIFEPTV